MTELLSARAQMAMSMAFHIVFACIGIAMPLLMVVAEYRWMKTGQEIYRTLAKKWARGAAIMFAVGAVSGTVLSFELGLLWPEFMRLAGPIIGMPFSLEGFAFFTEAIFLGIYFYAWDRISPKAHLAAGVAVLVSGTMSGIFVVTANAWMQTPTGFDMLDGVVTAIRPFEAMFNPSWLTQTSHMTVAAFVAVGFAAAAIHARQLLKDPENLFHQKAFGIALLVAAVSAPLPLITGHFSGEHVANTQPAKFAALEGHWETERCAPLILGGLPDEVAEVTRYAIKIPCGLSILAHMDPNAEVTGLKDIPKDERPPVAIVHIAFQIMVLTGLFMIGVAAIAAFLWRKNPVLLRHPRFLKLMIVSGPLGFIALEAGWTVTEVGRQPWIIQGIMRTEDAVTHLPLMIPRMTIFALVYLVLAGVVITLMRYHVFTSPKIYAGATGLVVEPLLDEGVARAIAHDLDTTEPRQPAPSPPGPDATDGDAP